MKYEGAWPENTQVKYLKFILKYSTWANVLHSTENAVQWALTSTRCCTQLSPPEAAAASKQILADEHPVAMETSTWVPDVTFANGWVSDESFIWQRDFFKFVFKENKQGSRVCLQTDKPFSSPAEQQLHYRPARRAALSTAREFVCSELICLLETFQNDTLNVFHSTQICD